MNSSTRNHGIQNNRGPKWTLTASRGPKWTRGTLARGPKWTR
jgi:hypothetical protein